MWLLLAIGFVSILGQVVLLRELSVASYGIELVYLLAVGVWLLAGGVGALAGRWPRRIPTTAAGVALGLFGVVLPASVVFVRGARVILGAVPGAYLPFPQQLLVVVVALAPTGVLLGLLFQWAARSFIAAGRTLASAYGIESAGGLAAGLAGTLAFKWGIQTFAVAIACGFVAIVAAFTRPALRGGRTAGVVLGAGAIAAAMLAWKAGTFDRQMTGWNHPGLVDARDSPYGRVAVSRAAGQLAAFENDALWFDTEGTAAESFAHLVLLQHPNPQRVLLLGGGLEGIVSRVLDHAPRATDYVELDLQTYRTLVAYVPDDIRASLAAPGVRVIFTDPRRFLKQGDRYDAILVAMPEPDSGAANRFYTREFFAACARRLEPGGVLGFRLQSSENFWTPALSRRMVSIYRALDAVFPFIVVLPGTTNVFLASPVPLPNDGNLLAERLAERRVRTAVVTGAHLRYLYTNDRRPEIARVLASGRGPENSDSRPVCYEYAAIIWLSKFFPRLASSGIPDGDAVSSATIQWGAWVVLAAAFAIGRRSVRCRRALLVAAAGTIGMVLETILVLYFQMKNGVLFQDIGVLLTGFMAGLSAGALAFGWLAGPRNDRHATEGARGPLRPPILALCRANARRRWSGVAILALLAALSLFISAAATWGAAGGLLAVTILLAAAGALVAGLFAYASVRDDAGQAALVSPLYAADLLGGCAGSLLASLVLIPVAGLALTARWMAVLAAMSVALL